jgi:glycosyltransferase involved in cell wall biosynthesis
MLPTVYYILPTTAIGGAEKRFIELWCYLQHQKKYPLKLIASHQLLKAIQQNETLFQQVAPFVKDVITFDIDVTIPVIQFQKKLYQFICNNTSKKDILHFILLFPAFIYRLQHKKIVYSLTESSLQNVNINGKLLYWLSTFRSSLVDVLDPQVYATLQKWLWYKKSSIHNTPGSFVDTQIFKPAASKQNQFVILGRFFYVKQVVKLMNMLPTICNEIEIANTGIKDYSFSFIGYGQQEEELKNILQLPSHTNLPITISMSHQPHVELAKSSVIFALQLRNNYPSKSLLEGLAAGNIALATDVGNTRKIAQPAYSYYVPEDFSATDIAQHLITILRLSPQEKQAKMNAACQFVQQNCSIQNSADYYSGLYAVV